MNGNKTMVAIVLDRSGSMEACAADVIGGFNRLIEDQKKLPGECLVTLVQFDHEYQLLRDGVPVQQVEPLSPATFVPRGNTALLDAMGRTIVSVGEKLAAMPETDRPGKVLMVVLTDGHENASSEYTYERVREMIEHQKTVYSWEFVFIGSEPKAVADASQKLGIKSSFAYTNDPQGTSKAMHSVSRGIASYRSSGGYSHGGN